jgi:hypothetical protein
LHFCQAFFEVGLFSVQFSAFRPFALHKAQQAGQRYDAIGNAELPGRILLYAKTTTFFDFIAQIRLYAFFFCFCG